MTISRRAAILRMHHDLQTRENAGQHWKVVILKPGQSEEFPREWIWRHIGTTHHLMYFADAEEQQ